MQNLPVIYKNVVKGCKVFALIGGLSLCCACTDSQPTGDAGAGADVAPMSGEVQVSGGEVAPSPGGAAPAEAAPGSSESGAVADAVQAADGAEEATDGTDKQVAVADGKEPAKKKVAGAPSFADNVRGVRDPFDKFYGKPPVVATPTPTPTPAPSQSVGGEGGSDGAVTSPGGAIGAANSAVSPGGSQAGGASVAPSAVSDFKVTGILRSNAGYRAILQGPDKAAVVAPGDKAFGYRVAAIGDKSVTLVFSNKCKFVLPLQKEEFKSSGDGQGAAGSNIGMVSSSK